MMVIQKSQGQLGNKLLISAHAIAYCLSQGEALLNFTLLDEASYFDLYNFRKKNIYIIKNSWVQYVFNFIIQIVQKLTYWLLNYRIFEIHRVGWIHSEIREIKSRQAPLFILEGEGFRSTNDLRDQATLIRHLFTPKWQYDTKIKNIIGSISKDNDVLIGIHLRRGDYNKWQGGKYYYDNQTYMHFIQQLRSMFVGQNIKFILCSDEIIDTTYFSDDDMYISTQDMIIDLYLLASCDYLIGPPSTFSGWASFYANIPLYVIESKDVNIHLKNFKQYTL
jgi:hypothetical protein